MPSTINYSPLLPLLSDARLNSFQNTFKPSTDAELYGIYCWSQYAAASLYPLLQSLEVTLRNTIDIAIRNQYGDFWWDTIHCNKTNISHTSFYSNIQSAIEKLTREWQKRERMRLGLNKYATITSTVPVWSHDQIVAATDFSTWQFILNGDFHKQNDRDFIWPSLLGKAFKNFSIIDNKPSEARKKLIDLIEELRGYRNRIFHHEPIWVKSSTVSDGKTAIDTIRSKINKIERIIESIDRRKLDLMKKSGVFMNARRINSIAELNVHRSFDSPKLKTLDELTSAAEATNSTQLVASRSQLFGLYKVR